MQISIILSSLHHKECKQPFVTVVVQTIEVIDYKENLLVTFLKMIARANLPNLLITKLNIRH